jgi:hypothetical protein
VLQGGRGRAGRVRGCDVADVHGMLLFGYYPGRICLWIRLAKKRGGDHSAVRGGGEEKSVGCFLGFFFVFGHALNAPRGAEEK